MMNHFFFPALFFGNREGGKEEKKEWKEGKAGREREGVKKGGREGRSKERRRKEVRL
jgi:hypothetical protein